MNETCKELIYRFLDELKHTYYTTSSICQYQKPLDELLTYCEENSIDVYTPEVAESYIIDRFKDTANNDVSKLQLYTRTLNMLTYFQKNNVVPYRCAYTEYHFPEWFYPAYQEFVEYRRYRNLKENTIKKQHRSFEKLGQYLDRNGITSFDMLNINILQQYVSSISELSLAVSYNAVSALRMFLGFLYDRKYISVNFKEFIPNVKYSHNSNIPSVYTPEEVEKLLNIVDRANPTGKRDFAMLLIAARLGLRSSDICRLCFENIDWDNNQINIIQYKTNEQLQLPLTAEIGNAIIDYVRHGRPDSDYRNVFLRHIRPIEPIGSSSVHCMIQRYFYAAGININGRKHGPHALRHSLASNMLEGDTSLPTISEILGHTSTSSTQIYLKIDISHLRKCALPLMDGGESF